MSNGLPVRTRSTACLSDLTLDSWLSGELAVPLVRVCERHLQTCERCRARHKRLEADRSIYLAAQPALPADITIGREPMRVRRWATRLVPALAAAAALWLVFLPPAQEGGGERTKGAERIGVMVKHGETVRRGQSQETVYPGDQLRFVYSCSEPRYLALVSLDAKGHVSAYFPQGPRAERVVPGAEKLLPSAVELDDTLGLEKVVALFCSEPIEMAQLLEEAKQGRLDARPGCSRQEISFTKEALQP